MWPVVLLGSLGCFLLKLIGYVLPERLLTDHRVRRVTALIPVALLAALVVIQTFAAPGGGVTLDARAAGLAAAVVALLLRAPFLVVVVVAAVAAALVRHAGLAT